MGKAGRRELNYVSDVDVIFVAEPADERALATATTLAAQTMQICRAVAWEVDAALRPEGRDGPLVRTLASHEAYYKRWARPGSSRRCSRPGRPPATSNSGGATDTAIAPLVWAAAERPDFVADVQAMRRRTVANLPRRRAGREIKLGPGGLRDVEFAVQLLQLVHGRGRRVAAGAGNAAALAALATAATSGGETQTALPTRTGSCGRSSTGSNCTECGVPTWCPTTPTNSAGWRQHGHPTRCGGSAIDVFEAGALTPARCAGCTRSSSTGRCSTRWPGCRARRCGSPRRPAGASPHSDMPIRPARYDISRR